MKQASVFLKSLFILLLSTAALGIKAQMKTFQISPVLDTLLVDSMPIAVSTVVIHNQHKNLVPGADFVFSNHFKVILILHPENYDTLWLQYQTFPSWLFEAKQRYKPPVANFGIAENTAITETKNTSETNINTDGILLRGISFGNAQDLVLNSSLNLRMSGQIGNGISIEGAITDQEFPFQPEGTTSTLQDFDRVYIAVHLPKTSVLLGDYPFQSAAGSRFMKYSKKNRGIQITGRDTLQNAVIKYEGTAALSRGRFQRNEINGVEGLQGPYRLLGARGEQFIVVVSGTEVVYLDGVKMERGLQADYVMDYNTGEITFTPLHIVNAFSRIVVEFQYSDRFYTRSVLGANATVSKKKVDYFVGIFSEQDARNQPIQQDLDAYDSTTNRTVREILGQSGDNPNLAQLSGVRKVNQFSSSEPNYFRRDTGSVVFYEYTNLPDTHTSFYRLNFSYTGPGKGTYVLTGTTANGKVYRYVGFISGIPAGDYEPISLVQAPNRLSMAEFGAQYKPRVGTEISGNISVSGNDKNLFSPIGDADNRGVAGYVSIKDRRNLGGKDSNQKWFVQNALKAEQTSAGFVSIERYRDVEFGRQWNRSLYNPENGLETRSSAFANGQVDIGKGDRFLLTAKGGLNSSAAFKAQTGALGLRYRYKDLFVEPNAEWGESKASILTNSFAKKDLRAGWEHGASKIILGARNELSVFSDTATENLSQSYGLKEYSIRMERSQGPSNLSLSASQRTNQNLKLNEFENAVQVRNVTAEIATMGKKYGSFKLATSYRNMQLLDTFFKNMYANENHLAARLEYGFTKIFQFLSGNVYYQTISGREQQRQYSYFEVPAGQGFFTWIDFNGNGVKEVNEFQETLFKDQGRYVRLLIPTGNYIKAQSTEFNGNLQFQNRKSENEKPKARFLNRLTWNYNGKSIDSNWLDRIVPFVQAAGSTQLLALQSFVRNMAEYESKSKKWLLQYNWQKRNSKAFFTLGFDRKYSQSHQLFVRTNPGTVWQFRWSAEIKNSTYESEILSANNYQYQLIGTEPHVIYQPGNKFRFTVFGKLGNYTQASSNIARLVELGVQYNQTLGKSGMLETRISSLQARYDLAKGTPLSYDILQGFSAGRNFRGIVDLRFNAAKNIQIIVAYEGRKTADVKLIHVGRVEARYLF